MRFNVSLGVKNQSGIYKISNSIDSRIYIGKAVNFQKRFYQHYYCLKRNKGNRKFYEFLRNYPIECLSFEIVEICSKAILKEREEFYIKFYDCVKNGFNILHNDEEFVILYPHACEPYKKREKVVFDLKERKKVKKKRRKTKGERYISSHKAYFARVGIECPFLILDP